MANSRLLPTRIVDFFRDLGMPGALLLAGICLLIAMLPTLFIAIRPPTVDEVEIDVLSKWIDVITAESSETLPGLVVSDNHFTCERLLESLGQLIDQQGDRFVIPTAVEYLRVIKPGEAQPFAQWRSTQFDETEGYWKDREWDLLDKQLGKVGTLQIRYKFYPSNRSGLEFLPTIQHLKRNYSAAGWLLVFLAVLITVAVVSNLSLMRERAARLQSQQVTLDLARQMCHELRNGLWAFSLEGKNIRQLFQMVDDYLESQDETLERAADKAGLDQKQKNRLLHTFSRLLVEQNIDPRTDLQPCNDMAKEAQKHVEGFSRYINLTVEELDRNLLGGAASWDPQAIRLTEAWAEACALLEMRFRSAGVSHREVIETEQDWVEGDRRALVHAFINLAKNAIEAMRDFPGERCLTFRVHRDDTLHCTVHNTGVPISPDVLPYIFQRGYSTKQGAGRGTGLAIVVESLHRMGGSIAVSSNAEEGTFFLLNFKPFATPSLPSQSQSIAPQAIID